MTVAFEAGYSLPGSDLPLNHARILHGRNRRQVKTVYTAQLAAGSDGEEPLNGLTFEQWRPFDNELLSPTDLSTADWTVSELTLGSDNQTLAETTANAQHYIEQAFTFTAAVHVLAFKIKRETMPQIQVRAYDGTTSFTCFFNTWDGSVGTAANCTGTMVDLGENQYLCRIYFTPAAASGVVQLLAANASEVTTYAGTVTNTIQVLQGWLHLSEAAWENYLFTSQEVDVCCIGAHNLGTRGGTVTIQRFTSSWVDIMSITPTDDSPIMAIFEPLTDDAWRIKVEHAAGPAVGVVWFGKALQMERPFYGGFAPSQMNRSTVVRGNKSEGGQWLGRSTVRRSQRVSYAWQNLTAAWVRANLDGPQGLIRSLETVPFFLAWRPSELNDVDYGWTGGPVEGPVNQGVRDLMSFTFGAEVYGYE